MTRTDPHYRCDNCNAPIDLYCGLCESCAAEEDERHDAEIAERESWPRCSCPYCFCHEQTEYGEMCGNCRNHAHQG